MRDEHQHQKWIWGDVGAVHGRARARGEWEGDDGGRGSGAARPEHAVALAESW